MPVPALTPGGLPLAHPEARGQATRRRVGGAARAVGMAWPPAGGARGARKVLLNFLAVKARLGLSSCGPTGGKDNATYDRRCLSAFCALAPSQDLLGQLFQLRQRCRL
jgi:hypothetical protein